MITTIKDEQGARKPTVHYGLSTDAKPDAVNADVFYAIDTAKIYIYNEAGATWVEQ